MSALVWTKTPPSVPGWYWVRSPDGVADGGAYAWTDAVLVDVTLTRHGIETHGLCECDSCKVIDSELNEWCLIPEPEVAS